VTTITAARVRLILRNREHYQTTPLKGFENWNPMKRQARYAIDR
jgi:hypothetical protein